MTDAIGDILGGKNFSAPPEIKIIKDYIKKEFDSEAQVTIGANQIVITVSSAPLAGALRLQLHKLQELCNTDKRLLIRINN